VKVYPSYEASYSAVTPDVAQATKYGGPAQYALSLHTKSAVADKH